MSTRATKKLTGVFLTGCGATAELYAPQMKNPHQALETQLEEFFVARALSMGFVDSEKNI